MRVASLLACALFAAACLPVSAQTLKPGLWEIHNKVDGAEMGAAMAELQKELASMSPQERKQMEAMMGQHGVKMAPSAGGGMAVQVCMTKEMVERNDMPVQDGCRTTQHQRSGNTLKMAFTCASPPSSGEGQFTFSGPEAYTSRMTLKTAAGGKNETTRMEARGKWLKADCGNVKPPQVTRK